MSDILSKSPQPPHQDPHRRTGVSDALSDTTGTTVRKVAIVTGVTGSIGAACASKFARNGWHVVGGYFGESGQDESTAFKEAETSQGQTGCLLVPLDVANDGSCRAAVQATLVHWGRIDALINCAGTTRFIPHGDLEALDELEFHRVYDVNTVGAFRMTRACASALQASGEGAVVNISSIAGVRGTGSSLAYAASKGALNTMTLSLARSLAPSTRVNAIAPGFVSGGLPSRMLAADRYTEVVASQTAAAKLKRTSDPGEIAALAWFLCACAPGMTGQVVIVDNGLQL